MDDLLARYGDDVYRLAMYYTGNHADAEDISQSVFIKALTQCDVSRGDASVKSWLLKVTANESKNLLSSSWRKRVSYLDDRPEYAPIAEMLPYLDLYSAIGKLHFPEKQVIWAHYFEGMSSEEIARSLGCPAATVRSRLSRAREKLGRALG